MPGRRSFLIGCGCFVTAPAFAEFWPHWASGSATQSQLADPSPQSTLANPTTPATFVMRIDGWELPNEAEDLTGGHLRVRINSSWRASWR
jgi:hypothetical protein